MHLDNYTRTKELDEALNAALALVEAGNLPPKEEIITRMALKVLHGFLLNISTIATAAQYIAERRRDHTS